MNISNKGVRFIAKHEGFYSKPYNDVAGHATIGYGKLLHYGPCTKEDVIKWCMGLTKKDALAFLKRDLRKYVAAVNKGLKVNVSQNQFDALVSLCYNIGIGGFKRSTVLKTINRVERWWKVWNKITKNGKRQVCKGLKNRRQFEWLLFSEKKY